MSKTDETIGSILATATPVKTAQPMRLLLGWLAVTVVGTFLMVLFMAPRDDLALQLASPLFLAETILLIALIVTSAFVAVCLCFPDMCQRHWMLYAPLLPLAAYSALLGYQLVHPEMVALPAVKMGGVDCALCISMFAVIPGFWMFHILHRHATTHPILAGAVSLLTASSIGHLVLKFVEKNDAISHLALWHFLPILLLAAVGAFLGRKFLSW
ncbi:MAG: DUF1109 domain-containing protein [Proteobacteria bacterium]|nr:DUF1109 domain-containing protein [Pseudomonadota bacterium]